MNFSHEVRGIRLDRNETISGFARMLGLTRSGYSGLEYSGRGYSSKSVRAVMNADFFTTDEEARLKRAYKEKKDFELKGIPIRKSTIRQVQNKRKYETKKVKHPINSVTKPISDVPNFYEKLNALGDLNILDNEDSGLVELQKELGVRT